MSVVIVTYWSTLFRLARQEAEARRLALVWHGTEDTDSVRDAARAHEAYRQLVLTSDRTV